MCTLLASAGGFLSAWPYMGARHRGFWGSLFAELVQRSIPGSLDLVSAVELCSCHWAATQQMLLNILNYESTRQLKSCHALSLQSVSFHNEEKPGFEGRGYSRLTSLLLTSSSTSLPSLHTHASFLPTAWSLSNDLSCS